MRRLAWVVPIAFFFLNPGFACGPAEPEFQYGAAEMEAAVEGDWSLNITPEGGTATQVTVHIAQGTMSSTAAAPSPDHSLVRSAYACGTRTLVKGAAACVDISELPLAVTFVSGDAAFEGGPLSGTFRVFGTTFTAAGTLNLVIGPFHIESLVNPDGSLNGPHISPAPGARVVVAIFRSTLGARNR